MGKIMTVIRDALEVDFDSIIKLNDGAVQFTSAMDMPRLHLLAGMSCYLKVALIEGAVAAFLMAMRDGTAYDSENYRWFAARFPRFLYVDRIVVGPEFSGLGIASKLYSDLFDYARLNGMGSVTCEYNIEPPNPASRAFHDKFGFRELDTQWVAGGSKKVSLQAANT